MVKLCSIISCKSQYTPGSGRTYHSFPPKETEQKKWLDAIPAELIKKVTARSFVCSLHFVPENYHNTPTGRNFLKRDAIPTCFKLLSNGELQKTQKISNNDMNMNCDQHGTMEQLIKEDMNLNNDRDGIMKKWREENVNGVEIIGFENKVRYDKNISPKHTCNKADATTQVSPKRLKPSSREKTLMSKVDMLQKRLKRRETRVKILEGAIKALKESSTYSEGVESILEKHFSDAKLQLLLNEVNNNNVPPNHRQYREQIRQFALTIYFYSPIAYEVLREYLYLPHSATIRRWMSTYECEPGLLTKVFSDSETE